MLDYSAYPDGGRYYSGAEKKRSILINGNAYLVKFQKNSREGLRFNHVSEFLGSHIFSMLGIETQRDASEIISECMAEGVLVIKAKTKVRLLPALNIPWDLLKKSVEILKEIISKGVN